MSRLARPVVPGLSHHVTQRGNGRAQVFFGDDDYALYRALMAETIGRPLGSDDFIREIEELSHRPLKPAKPGPKPKTKDAGKQIKLI